MASTSYTNSSINRSYTTELESFPSNMTILKHVGVKIMEEVESYPGAPKKTNWVVLGDGDLVIAQQKRPEGMKKRLILYNRSEGDFEEDLFIDPEYLEVTEADPVEVARSLNCNDLKCFSLMVVIKPKTSERRTYGIKLKKTPHLGKLLESLLFIINDNGLDQKENKIDVGELKPSNTTSDDKGKGAGNNIELEKKTSGGAGSSWKSTREGARSHEQVVVKEKVVTDTNASFQYSEKPQNYNDNYNNYKRGRYFSNTYYPNRGRPVRY